MVLNRNLAGDVYGFLPSSQPEEDELLQQRHTAGAPSKHGKKKLLIILHGKRIDDDSVRCAIQQIREEGHEVSVYLYPISSCLAPASIVSGLGTMWMLT